MLQLWDNSQCLITDEHSNEKCVDHSRPLYEMRMHGLNSLLMGVHSSVGQVILARERTPHRVTSLQAQVQFLLKELPAAASAADRIHFVTHAPELAFLDTNIHDDARQGIATLSHLEAHSSIMQSMLSELRILFGLNIAFSVIVSCRTCAARRYNMLYLSAFSRYCTIPHFFARLEMWFSR